MTDSRLEKLPRYSIEEIRRLRNEVASLKETLDVLRCSIPTKIRWGYETLGDVFGYIPETETIHFLVGQRRSIRARLKEDGTVLNINADDGLVISPCYSNDIDLKLKR